MRANPFQFKRTGPAVIHIPTQARFVLNEDRTDFASIDWGFLSSAGEYERAVIGHLAWRLLKGW
jgi:hypothetical protein